ncbi:hypothetical protein ACCS79_03610 [Rhizobium johnstonii]|uniref:hypothetical protein n=1 Tax=Rhizobium johnstonii TaxID=3019933 RepID=UPI003F98CC5D
MSGKQRQNGIEMSRRAFAGISTSVDFERRSFPIVIATETPCRTWIPNPAILNPETEDCSFIEVDEVLPVDTMDYSRTLRMPLLDSHDSYTGIAKILGRIDNVRPEITAEVRQIVGDAVLPKSREALLSDVQDGFFTQISAGYVVHEYELTERPGDVPIARATRWTLLEGSIVAVGADPNASVRGKRTFPMPTFKGRASEGNNSPPEEKKMDLEELVDNAVTALDAVVDATDEGASDEAAARAAKLRKLRADFEAEPDKKDENADGARAEDDAALTDAEKKDIEAVRSIAAPYGKTKLVDDLVKLGSRAASIKKAVRSAIEASAAATVRSASEVEPQRPQAPVTLDVSDIYARANGMFRGGR